MASEFVLALAQQNFMVGDLDGNRNKIISGAIHARDNLGCQCVVFPELTISGYPPEDLLLRRAFIRDCQDILLSLANAVPGIALVVGHPYQANNKLYNAASLIDAGLIRATYCKHHLPNYGVFDEKRYFHPGTESCVEMIDGVQVGITICEDVWEEGPVERAVTGGANLILTLNGSPFDTSKNSMRENEVVSIQSKQNRVSIVYVNLVGGQDELVFDGGSLVTDENGLIRARAPLFEEAIMKVKFSVGENSVKPAEGTVEKLPQKLQSIYAALTLGVRDYIQKNGFESAVVGLSGGIDSALTLAIVADAIGQENVKAVLMPSRFTQTISVDDAIEQCKRLGVSWSIVSIEPIYEAFLRQLAEYLDNSSEADVTEENIQARCRGSLLMAISNKTRSIVITTGNKSEVAVGYSTLYGDMVGGFSAIKDVPKTLVYELARYRNENFGNVIPQRVFDRPPSAELADNQLDSDTLPPYEVLDRILEEYVENRLSTEEIVELGYPAKVVKDVVRMVKNAEYKRRQAAPGVRITPRAFGRDRRYPISNRY